MIITGINITSKSGVGLTLTRKQSSIGKHMSLQLKEKSEKDLARMLEEKRSELRSFRFGIAGSKTKNVRAGRALRKDAARLLTAIRSRA